jgi:hypothetical protein
MEKEAGFTAVEASSLLGLSTETSPHDGYLHGYAGEYPSLASSEISVGPAVASHTFEIKSASGAETVLKVDKDGAITWSDKHPGLNWATALREYEIEQLRRVASGIPATVSSTSASSALPPDVMNLLDFARYLIEALKRQAANGYSISPYQLAEDTAKIILGQTAFNFPGVNTPEYSHRISVDETKFVNLCQQMKQMEERLGDLRDELNHKDKLWGTF